MRRLSETTFHVRFSPKEKQGLLRCHVIAQKTNGATRRFPSAESTAPEVSRVLLPPEKPQSIRTIHLVNVEPFKAPTYRYGIRVRGGPESAPSRGRSAAVVTDQEGNRDLHDFVRIATRLPDSRFGFEKDTKTDECEPSTSFVNARTTGLRRTPRFRILSPRQCFGASFRDRSSCGRW